MEATDRQYARTLAQMAEIVAGGNVFLGRKISVRLACIKMAALTGTGQKVTKTTQKILCLFFKVCLTFED